MKYILLNDNIKQYLTVFLLIGTFFLDSSSLNAQIRPFDNGEIATLNRGSLQSDTYFSRTSFDDNDQSSLSTILRYGLRKNYEIQLTWTGNRFNGIDKDFSSESTNLGIKMYLNEQNNVLPTLSLIASVNLSVDPSASPFSPSLNLLYEKNLTDKWLVNGNYQLSLNEQERDLSMNYSFNIETDITSWQTTYIGIIGNGNPSKDGDYSYQNYIELGLLFWIRDGISLYPFYDFGLSEKAGNIFNIGALFTLNK